MSSIRAMVVDPSVIGRLAINEVESPKAGISEALVQVEAISLNRGEVRDAMEAEAGCDQVGIWPEPSSNKMLMPQGQRLGAELWVWFLFMEALGLSKLLFLVTCWLKFSST